MGLNQKIVNILIRINILIFKVLLFLRKIPIIGVFSYCIYKLIGIDIPAKVKIGKNLKLVHGANGLVVHQNTTIGDNVKLYQGVTIGRADIHKSITDSEMEGFIIDDGAIVCAGSKLLCKKGILRVGKNTIIGANSVLLESTGDNEIWCGAPAKKIKDIS